jgi:hypothetical protein
MLKRGRSGCARVAVVVVLTVGALAPVAGTAAEASEPSAPVFTELRVWDLATVNPDLNQGPALAFTATDPDGIRTVSATWCRVQQPEVCVTPTTGDISPGTTTLTQGIRKTMPPDAPMGTYRLREVRVTDQAGESSDYLPDGTVATTPADLPGPGSHSYDLRREFIVVDHTAPELKGFRWSSPGGDIAVPGERPPLLDLDVVDDGPGPLSAQVTLTNKPATPMAIDLSGTLAGDGTSPVRGTLQASTSLLNSGHSSGSWRITGITIKDTGGNSTFYRADGVAVRHEGNNYTASPHGFDFAGSPMTLRNPSPQWLSVQPVADSTLEVGWRAAVDADGAPPQTYTVTARPWVDGLADSQDGSPSTEQWASPDPGATPAVTKTVSGTATTARINALDNGRRYLVTVTANMSDGRRHLSPYYRPERPRPDLTITPQASVVEGNGAEAYAVLTARISSPSKRSVTLRYVTEPGTATTADFRPAFSGFVYIPPGRLSTQIRIPVVGDTADEGDEQFSVQYFPLDAAPPDRASTVTIIDDDPAPGSALTIGSATTKARRAGHASAVFAVRLARPLKRPVTVTYGTRNRTAVAGRDYASTRGALRFRPGVTTRYIRVPIYARPRVRTDSFFVVRLSHAVGTSVARGIGRGRIRR